MIYALLCLQTRVGVTNMSRRLTTHSVVKLFTAHQPSHAVIALYCLIVPQGGFECVIPRICNYRSPLVRRYVLPSCGASPADIESQLRCVLSPKNLSPTIIRCHVRSTLQFIHPLSPTVAAAESM
jgi:hypothetical protein